MSVTLTSKTRIDALISAANSKTGGSAADLTTAVQALCDGFGTGGGNTIQIGQNTPSPNWVNLFYALEHGTASTGEFTLASALPGGENLIFASGLAEISGIIIIDTDRTAPETGGMPEATWFSFALLAQGELIYGVLRNSVSGSSTSSFLSRCTWRIDGGDLYVTPTYANNANYTPFQVEHKYRWVVW